MSIDHGGESKCSGSGSDHVHQLGTPESNAQWVLMPWRKISDNFPITPGSDSLASSVVKEGGWLGKSEENVRKATLYSDVGECSLVFHFCFVPNIILFYIAYDHHIDCGGGGHLEHCGSRCHVARQTRVNKRGRYFLSTQSALKFGTCSQFI